jgi:hypothetical protein
MMIRFLSDHDIELYVRLLWTHFSADEWRGLGVADCHMFADLHIDLASSDRNVWLRCQHEQLLLITGNRNMEGEDSLEAVIRDLNQVDSLPVITIARPKMMVEFKYREDCAYRIADIVADLSNLRGTGRQVVP